MTWSSSCSTWLSAADDCREPCVFCSMLWSSHVAFMLLSTVSGRWSMMRLYKRNRAYKNIKCIFNDAPSTRQPIVEHTLCWTHSFFAGHGSIVVLQVFLHTLFASGGREKYPQCRPISTSMPPVETKFQRLPFSRSMQQSNGTTWNILYDQTGSGKYKIAVADAYIFISQLAGVTATKFRRPPSWIIFHFRLVRIVIFLAPPYCWTPKHHQSRKHVATAEIIVRGSTNCNVDDLVVCHFGHTFACN